MPSTFITRSNKKRNRSFHKLLKNKENFASYSKSQSNMIYPGIMIGNGALNSQFNRSPRDSNSIVGTFPSATNLEKPRSRSRSNKGAKNQSSTSNLRTINKLPSTEAEEDV